MSKITRDEIVELCTGYKYPVDGVMRLIDQREAELQAQYGELVQAAVAWDRLIPDPRYRTNEVKALHKAIQPHLPPLSLADRLDALADNPRTWYQMLNGLRAIAAELREGEG